MNYIERENEYRNIFLTEALEGYTEINRLLTKLEKNPQDESSIHEIFRITHTLKGNATGMGFDKIAEFAHLLEDLFSEIRDGKIFLSSDVFSVVYKAVDILGQFIASINQPRDIKYRGIKTKLELLIKEASSLENKIKENKRQVITEPKEKTENNPDFVIRTEDLEEEPGDDQSALLSFSDLVQVPISKLDNLLTLVSELAIERDRIIALNEGYSRNEFARLYRISSDLQYSVMNVRLVQVGFLFNKFHRIVRDAAIKEGKKVDLKLSGTDVEVDRNILQVISDSLVHILRNAISHGIEPPEIRLLNNKEEAGVITLNAVADTDSVCISISDDGSGIDTEKIKNKAIALNLFNHDDVKKLNEKELINLIFQPGFSTMEGVTSIAGRGVGLDVVKRAFDAIGGTIQVTTVIGQGTTFYLNLPASMAVKSVLLFEVSNQVYAIPLSYTDYVFSTHKSNIKKSAGRLLTINQDQIIELYFLHDVFSVSLGQVPKYFEDFDSLVQGIKYEIVVVTYNEKKVGFIVEKLLQQKEIIEKPLKKPLDQVSLISGSTILGNGNVCLVLNVVSLLNFIKNNYQKFLMQLN